MSVRKATKPKFIDCRGFGGGARERDGQASRKDYFAPSRMPLIGVYQSPIWRSGTRVCCIYIHLCIAKMAAWDIVSRVARPD